MGLSVRRDVNARLAGQAPSKCPGFVNENKGKPFVQDVDLPQFTCLTANGTPIP